MHWFTNTLHHRFLESPNFQWFHFIAQVLFAHVSQRPLKNLHNLLCQPKSCTFPVKDVLFEALRCRSSQGLLIHFTENTYSLGRFNHCPTVNALEFVIQLEHAEEFQTEPLNNAGRCFVTRNKGRSQTLYASASIWSNYGMWVTPSPQEAICLFLLPFSLRKQKRCQPGQHLLPREPTPKQGTPEAQLLLQMCPRCEQDRQLGRQIPCTSRESGMCCQEPAGRCNHPNPAHSTGVILWQLLYYFKEETLSCSHYWFILAQNWAQEFQQ